MTHYNYTNGKGKERTYIYIIYVTSATIYCYVHCYNFIINDCVAHSIHTLFIICSVCARACVCACVSGVETNNFHLLA